MERSRELEDRMTRLAYNILGDEYSVHLGIAAGIEAALRILEIKDGDTDGE